MVFVRGLILTVLVFLVAEPRVIVGEYAGCDGSVQTIDLSKTSNGTIHSPGYPYYYGNNKNCEWLIKASPMEKVLIYFTTFGLENCCDCDKVEIFDGPNSYYTRKSRSCGSSLPPPVYSSGRHIFVRFTSDYSVTGQGFVAHYRALNNSSGCPPIVPGASAGVIYSPNFPWNYPISNSCEWFITAPVQKMIKLYFTRFNVENDWDYVEVRNESNGLIGKYSGTQIPSSITLSRSMSVRFHSDSSVVHSGFMAFYQTGYSFPTTTPYPPTIHWHWTTNPWYWTTKPWYWTTKPWYWTTNPWYWTTKPPSPPAASKYACKPNYITSISVGSYDSSSISSPNGDDYYYTKSPKTTCTFQIDTTQGYILELSFDDMSISSCSRCSCGYVKVRDGSSSSAQLLGTYCNDYYQDTVSSKGNHMFVEYYGYYSSDSFQATVRSKKGSIFSSDSFQATVRPKKGTPVNVAAIVVPIVVAIVLFSIIFVVIKCTTIRRSAGPVGSSGVNEVALQPLSHRVELPPTTQSQSSNAEFGTSVLPQIHPPDTVIASLATSQSSSHPYSDPFTTAAAPPPLSTDHSQGVGNMSMEDGTEQL